MEPDTTIPYFNSLKQSRRSHRCSSQFNILNPQ
ncbi:hypothetical protein LINPERHAP1_LOCUS15798 [Linum perenne]